MESPTRYSRDLIHGIGRGVPNELPRDDIFNPHGTAIKDSYSLRFRLISGIGDDRCTFLAFFIFIRTKSILSSFLPSC